MEVILQGNKLPKDKVLLQSAIGKTRKKKWLKCYLLSECNMCKITYIIYIFTFAKPFKLEN